MINGIGGAWEIEIRVIGALVIKETDQEE